MEKDKELQVLYKSQIEMSCDLAVISGMFL
jgi:hypothetical protein